MTRQDGPSGFEMKDSDSTPQQAGPLSFANLVLSLSASALVHLGVAPRPEGEADPEDSGERHEEFATAEPNLPMAQQTIEILEMLQGKTQGNLDPDEDRLLREVLHDLHMRFVKAKDPAS